MNISPVRFQGAYYSKTNDPEEAEKAHQAMQDRIQEDGGGIRTRGMLPTGEHISLALTGREYDVLLWAMGWNRESLETLEQYAATIQGEQQLYKVAQSYINFLQIAGTLIFDVLTGKPYEAHKLPQPDSGSTPATPATPGDASGDAETETPPDDKKLDAFRDFINGLDLDDFGNPDGFTPS